MERSLVEENTVRTPILLSSPVKQTEGYVEIQTLSQSQRISGAAVRATVGLLATAISIVIPVLHFILVPIGLLITWLMVSRALTQKSVIKGGEGRCPYCDFKIPFVARRAEFPFLERCPSCSRESKITEAA